LPLSASELLLGPQFYVINYDMNVKPTETYLWLPILAVTECPGNTNNKTRYKVPCMLSQTQQNTLHMQHTATEY